MSDIMDHFDELRDEIDRLKVVLDIKQRELKAARVVVKASYWWLAYTYQSHMVDFSKNIDMTVFERGLRELMPNVDRDMFDALEEYAIAMGFPA